MDYVIHKAEVLPSVRAEWDGLPWSAADTITIERFVTRGHDHKPRTQVRDAA